MKKRSLFIIVLLVAFLLSAWGNVIGAAFCPRYLSNREYSIKPISQESQQVERTSSCHHEMAGMEMGDMQMETEMESGADVEASDNAIPEARPIQVGIKTPTQQVVINFPDEPCGHCWMHSQPTSGTATLVAVNPSKQLIDTKAPPAEAAVTVPNAFIVSITPVGHGPPGNLLPRHVLINVFRI